ncbi:uncharacterized protein LOC107623408 [Arachis ipaensis]|uniref:uncharacterized protein LOC107623408 n=1 Tax=Arachis ipaensis TaxID=130454 RepID=UPI000A2B6CE2|nr:uncharacterized protein LOC107623408 [Arachis ipaensis]
MVVEDDNLNNNLVVDDKKICINCCVCNSLGTSEAFAWISSISGIKVGTGFSLTSFLLLLLNKRLLRLIHTGEREEHEPYIEASQAQMVYYVDDMVNKGWSIAVHVKPRDMYDMGQGNEDIVYENEPYQEQELEQLFDPNNEYIQLATNLLDSDAIEDNVAANLARDMFE